MQVERHVFSVLLFSLGLEILLPMWTGQDWAEGEWAEDAFRVGKEEEKMGDWDGSQKEQVGWWREEL